MSNGIQIKGRSTLTEKSPESIELSKFVSHRAKISGDFVLSKDSKSTNFNQRPQIFVKLNFRELSYSKLSGLHLFDNTAIIH